jgi:hypothetical protein
LDTSRMDADGIFAEQYILKFCKDGDVQYIPHVYFVHN